VDVISVYGWPQEKVDKFGGWSQFLQKEGWKPGKETIFIFDEAQESYEDTELWSQFFKDFRGFGVLFAIAFASYGSPTSEDSYSSSASSINVHHSPRRTPVLVSDSQRVTLHPIDHQDGLHPVGLLFTEAEFNELVQKQFSSNEYRFQPSFFHGVFDFTGGHVGAIQDFLRIVLVHHVRFFHDVDTLLTSYLSLIVNSGVPASLTHGTRFWKNSVSMNL
jgi:hypothetical protein